MSKYLVHLKDLLTPTIYEFFLSLYDCSTPKGKHFLKSFQKNLENSENYNNKIVSDLTKTISIKYKEKLLLKIFMEEAELNKPDLFLKISFDDFVLQLLLNCRKDIWSNPNLFYKEGLSTSEIQKNYNNILKIIKDNVSKTIRFFVPYDVLLSKDLNDMNLEQEYSDEEYISEDETGNETDESETLFKELEEE